MVPRLAESEGYQTKISLNNFFGYTYHTRDQKMAGTNFPHNEKMTPSHPDTGLYSRRIIYHLQQGMIRNGNKLVELCTASRICEMHLQN
jgi:hypothetical protein